MITVTVNGKPRRIDGPATIDALLKLLEINPRQVAVAINGEVVPRHDWAATTISECDVVEVVRAVGGG